MQDLVHRQFGEGLASSHPLLQLFLEAHHGHAVPQMALPAVGQLGLVLDPLHGQQGIGQALDGQMGVALQGAEHRVVHRIGVGQDGLLPVVPFQPGQYAVVIGQLYPVAGQGLGGLGGQPLPVDEQDRVGLGDKAVGHGIGGALDIHGPQVEQPGEVVQLAHHLGGAALFGQFLAQAGQLLPRRGPGVLRRQQPGGGGGQGGTALDPQLILQGEGAHLHALGVQHFLQLPHQQAGGGEAAQAQALAFGQVGGAVFFHGGHARLTHPHQLDLGAGQLFFRLDEKPAVRPQGAALHGDHQGGVLPRKAREIFPAVVVGGQVFTGMRVPGGDQIGCDAGGLHSAAQGRQPLADSRHDAKPSFLQFGGRSAPAPLL